MVVGALFGVCWPQVSTRTLDATFALSRTLSTLILLARSPFQCLQALQEKQRFVLKVFRLQHVPDVLLEDVIFYFDFGRRLGPLEPVFARKFDKRVFFLLDLSWCRTTDPILPSLVISLFRFRSSTAPEPLCCRHRVATSTLA